MPEAASQLYTCVAKCRVCNAELDRAVHVPSEHREEVNRAAPLAALCSVKEHNTAADHNFNIVLEWYLEASDGLKLSLVTTPS